MPEPKLASESQDQFDQLQKKLVSLWKSIQSFNQDPQTIVVRSMSVDLAGQQKFFVASDHVESPRYRTLTPDDLFDIVVRHSLHSSGSYKDS